MLTPRQGLRLLALGALAAMLTGCKVYWGVVQDDYIKGARVCVDLNENLTCDPTEPSTLTEGDYGRFRLASRDTGAPLLAEVTTSSVNTATGEAVTRPYTLVAPSSHPRSINPLTTLVYAKARAGGLSLADAEAAVADALGLGSILDRDYQEAQDDDASQAARELAEKLADGLALVDDSQTADARVRMTLAVLEQVERRLWDGDGIADVVMTKGDIYATDLDDPANPRNAAAYGGDVEVIAGTGFHGTLFDSADNKCQHCHNELYDTWKKSMHAQSWSDPIFQSKYQDFLRVHIAKIGATGPTGTYTEGTFKKVAQVCVKCHAPGAFYTGDLQVELQAISDDPAGDFADARLTAQANLAPGYDPAQEAKVVSVSKTGKVYQASYRIGNKHNREGINCAYCHSVETVRLMNDTDGDKGEYQLANPLKAGPIGPVIYPAGDTLYYSADAGTHPMNAFFFLIGPEKYADPGDTPKDYGDFDLAKVADGRHTMASMPPGDYTGGPFYGPFGITALHNSRDDDDLDREALVNQHFADAVETFDGDEDLSPHHFAAYAKALCLSCHQRSAGALNPEFNDIPGVQPGDDQFMELCSTWTAMSDGVGDNYTDSPTAPKCQRCHMERIADKTVLHKWDSPDELFTLEDGVTPHFDPASGFGPVALEYLNNHAFMGANKKDFGLGKIISGFESSMSAQRAGGSVEVETSLLNKTAHMFPGAHPMRRVLTRVVVTDAAGQRLPYTAATGTSTFEGVTNQLATLPGETIVAGYETVDVAYDDSRTIVYQGKQADLDGGAVSSQAFDGSQLDWLSPDGTVVNSEPVQLPDGSWGVEGTATANKIVDAAAVDQFTRLYGRETGKKDPDDSTRFVVRPGFDSNIVRDNRLDPNERETYQVSFDASAVSAWPVTVRYKVYYMKKGASGKFPTGPDGFLNTGLDPATLKKLAIFEVFSAEAQVQ